jgi:hypothetical protein
LLLLLLLASTLPLDFNEFRAATAADNETGCPPLLLLLSMRPE